MKWLIVPATFFALAVPVLAQQGTITIQKVSADKEHVVVTFDHTPVDSTDQILVFVDDTFVRAVGGRSTVSVDLKPGNHAIDLRDATKEHRIRGGCKRVQVTISNTAPNQFLPPAGGEECKP